MNAITVYRVRGVDYEFEIFQSGETLSRSSVHYPDGIRRPLFELKILLLNSNGYSDEIENLTLDDLEALREAIDAAISAAARDSVECDIGMGAVEECEDPSCPIHAAEEAKRQGVRS